MVNQRCWAKEGGDAKIKIDVNMPKFHFVLLYLEYPLSLESEIRPIKYLNTSSF